MFFKHNCNTIAYDHKDQKPTCKEGKIAQTVSRTLTDGFMSLILSPLGLILLADTVLEKVAKALATNLKSPNSVMLTKLLTLHAALICLSIKWE